MGQRRRRWPNIKTTSATVLRPAFLNSRNKRNQAEKYSERITKYKTEYKCGDNFLLIIVTCIYFVSQHWVEVSLN